MSGCGSCGTDKSIPSGCGSKGSCNTGSCNKLTVFDWLSNMRNPIYSNESNFYEVRFKNDRKEFYKTKPNLTFHVGDTVILESKTGYDLGVVSLTGELVKIQYKKKLKDNKKEELPQIIRLANEKEINLWQELRQKEQAMMIQARKISRNYNVEMKISDIEFQGDGSKAIFYYTSESRVDFRQLIKQYATTFRLGIEMKQIGLRQEAAKLGGIGSCGRELCCSSWLTDFRAVNTSAAKYQQLSINPQKLAGQCGKLKCCLNYELDSYMDALKNFPSENTSFQTTEGKAYCVKINLFKEMLWFSEGRDSATYMFHKDEVINFMKMAKENGKTPSLKELSQNSQTQIDLESKLKTIEFKNDLIEENDLNRFGNQTASKKRKPKFKRRNERGK
jgi:cell fate regulator YaaT (PSP1 superfamily)